MNLLNSEKNRTYGPEGVSECIITWKQAQKGQGNHNLVPGAYVELDKLDFTTLTLVHLQKFKSVSLAYECLLIQF